MGLRLCLLIGLMVVLLLAAMAGRAAGKGSLGILIDERGRYSLNHFQIVMWTVMGLSAILSIFVARWFAGEADLMNFQIPQELLVLMGISIGSATAAGAVKSAKDAQGSTARVARAGIFTLSGGGTRNITSRFAQVVLEEEGNQADMTVDVTKFQNFVFTLLLGAAYCVLVWKQATLQGLPALSERILWLLGISHAGYVAGKMPTKP